MEQSALCQILGADRAQVVKEEADDDDDLVSPLDRPAGAAPQEKLGALSGLRVLVQPVPAPAPAPVAVKAERLDEEESAAEPSTPDGPAPVDLSCVAAAPAPAPAPPAAAGAGGAPAVRAEERRTIRWWAGRLRAPLRFFIVKSKNDENLRLSRESGTWATQAHNERKLDEAYAGGDVVLVFSVNNSRHFQGYSKMSSRVGECAAAPAWAGAGGREEAWGRPFRTDWLQVCLLPFERTMHLRNPANENKPVKISRDGQELPSDIGFALCSLIDDAAAASGSMFIPRPCAAVPAAMLPSVAPRAGQLEQVVAAGSMPAVPAVNPMAPVYHPYDMLAYGGFVLQPAVPIYAVPRCV
eukprot:m51a1_g11021 hypothetical protein (354) ;mRNA; r:405201-406705